MSSHEYIERAIQKRNLEQVRRLVPTFLKERGGSDAARLDASEFYRRISDFPAALRVLHAEISSLGAVEKLTLSQAKLQMQLARILNLLGASTYALRIIERQPKTARSHMDGAVAGILISNYRYAEALPHFQKNEGLQDSELTYLHRLQFVSLADCYFGLGNFDAASTTIERVLRLSTSAEPLIRAIALQAMASYLLMSGKTSRAESPLSESDRLFPAGDVTLDRGFLEKWIGAYLCASGRYAEARKRLRSAFNILYRSGLKPETWLEVLYFQGLCDFEEKRVIPHEWIRILAYPSPGIRVRQEILRRIETPEKALLSLQGCVKRKGTVHLDFQSDLRVSCRRGRHVWRVGLNLPDIFTGLLVLSGEFGIPEYRLYEGLWPDEHFSFIQHRKRIEQVVLRARADGTQVGWKNAHLLLSSTSSGRGPTCLWSSRPGFQGSLFLENHATFTREDVEEFFLISKRKAAYLCEYWEKRHHVIRRGRGPSTAYEAISPSSSKSSQTL